MLATGAKNSEKVSGTEREIRLLSEGGPVEFKQVASCFAV